MLNQSLIYWASQQLICNENMLWTIETRMKIHLESDNDRNNHYIR